MALLPSSTMHMTQLQACSRPAAFRPIVQRSSRRHQAIRAQGQRPDSASTFSRRQFLEAASLSAVLIAPQASWAAKAPSGFNPVQDINDGYQFLYPFGWQEISITGADVVYKDIIEPLESVSITLAPTDKTDITDFGDVKDVTETLARNVLTPANQEVTIVSSQQRALNGHNYYEVEFTAKSPRYVRHSLAVVAINNGKLYTLTTGSNERRWGKMKDNLYTVARSFAFTGV